MTSQAPASLLGKILRIDVDGGDPYSIPNNASGNEVWAMGSRNPWRMSFDRATGDLVVGDVGWGDHGEIEVVPAGAGERQVLNYGWPFFDGERCWLAISTFGEDEAGEIYLADYNSGAAPPAIAAVVNAASFGAGRPVAPGASVTVFAGNIGFQAGSDLFPAVEFDGVGVTIDGRPAPLFAVIPAQSQINRLALRGLVPGSAARVVVSRRGQRSEAFDVPVAAADPGIFGFPDPSEPARPYAAATLAGTAWIAVPGRMAAALALPTDCERNGVETAQVCGQPARAGQILQIFATGLGEATATGAAGGPSLGDAEVAPASAAPLSLTVQRPRVGFGSAPAEVLFSGLTPGFAGLYQINVRVPEDAPTGDAVPLTVDMPGAAGDTKLLAIERLRRAREGSRLSRADRERG